ncbi:hypothetical protein [Rhodococcoides yunnanense]|uniref:hypothetical protein n=1 Tax=Rhodococcoides yunnanense TaxID=278209 RepID=UPI00093294B0|nr:hypothetical protein [Rhodococcus yunnanensis]
MSGDSTGDVADQLALVDDEQLALTAACIHLMDRDIEATKSVRARELKIDAREEFAHHAFEHITNPAFGQADWARAVSKDTAGRSVSTFCAVLSAGVEEVLGRIDRRSRALLILIDLFTFGPWAGRARWADGRRKESLKQVADWCAGLEPRDVDTVASEYDAVVRQLRRKSIKWGRVAAVSIAGLGVGVVSAGAAAPLIGAALMPWSTGKASTFRHPCGICAPSATTV